MSSPPSDPTGPVLVAVEDAPEPFEEFFAREIRSVTGLAYSLTGSMSDAEELALFRHEFADGVLAEPLIEQGAHGRGRRLGDEDLRAAALHGAVVTEDEGNHLFGRRRAQVREQLLLLLVVLHLPREIGRAHV